MSEYVIEVQHVTKTYKLYSSNKRRIAESLFPRLKPSYRAFHALEDVSFAIKKGEIVGIIGKNGSGKSTLLKIITGVLNPSSGSVVVDGRISALLELGAGFNPEYTGVENIYLNGTLNRITREEMAERIGDIAKFADIGDFINQPVKNYSSGMFVRLAFAVAVYTSPDILIVDEALAVGDAAFQAKCMARMKKIMESGTTVLFVTHDMNTVKRLCQRCIYLENGHKIMEGSAAEIADIYLQNIREEMNKEHVKILRDSEEELKKESKENKDREESKVKNELYQHQEKNKYDQSRIPDVVETDFMHKTKGSTEGTGGITFINVELLNKSGEQMSAFQFNEIIRIRLTLIVNEETSFTVAYHIKDDKMQEILGSSALRETGQMIYGKGGDCFVVEFLTRLPIIEGNYNLMVLASVPIVRNRSALFLSLIENAAVFSVEEDFNSKLWDKVYVENQVTIEKREK